MVYSMGRRIRIFAIALVLFFLLSVPLAFVAYGAVGGLVGGVLILAPLIALQLIVLKLMQRNAASKGRKSRS